MQKYQVIARKYRPQIFADVIGQDPIVQTLKNALRLNKTAHAYLFSGSRGTGKTTLARLFAKALNCQDLTKEHEPCNQCPSCLEITSSSSLDVIEIDGASNRGIDDIRHINETLGYAPSSCFYKIYIIDEIHMLTKEAFNALLKTLEEPPPTIKFFFATTEAHKVPPTIISRCQRFDLARISHDLIVQKLLKITNDLTRDVQQEALFLISHFSEGSLRDAESILDQILCYEDKKISVDTINRALGFIPKSYFFQLDLATKKKDISFAFEFVNQIFQTGKDPSYFLEELTEHYRYLLITKMGNIQMLSNLSNDLRQKYEESASIYSQEQCLYILDFLLKSTQHLQKTPFKRVTLEMLILRIIQSWAHIPIAALVNRLIKLENSISTPKATPSISDEKREIELKEVPFNISPSLEKKKLTTHQSQYDTLLRFSAVELEGTVKIET